MYEDSTRLVFITSINQKETGSVAIEKATLGFPQIELNSKTIPFLCFCCCLFFNQRGNIFWDWRIYQGPENISGSKQSSFQIMD